MVLAGPAMATEGAVTVTAVASDGVSQPQVKAVGRLNVNTASRAELTRVPGLDGAAIEAILATRAASPIQDLARVAGIPAETLRHLKTEGMSNFTRILQNPLQVLAAR
jgi:DNA uptake protein ComE-like DNA-binding protein